MTKARDNAHSSEPSALQRARACYERRAWADACEAFGEADRAAALDFDDLGRWATCYGLTAHDAEFVKTWERAYEEALAAGRDLNAVRAGFWVCLRLSALGEMAQGNAWLARCQRIVDAHPEPHVERGYLKIPTTFRLRAMGDLAAAEAEAREAVAIGERFGDADLIALGRQCLGRVVLYLRRMEEGLACLDEAMLSASRGELSPTVTGLVYCSVLVSCQQVYALDRAREWTQALSDWCAAQPQMLNFSATCLVHRAELLQLNGDWPESIAQARKCAERSQLQARNEAARDAFYQEAEIHRLRGEFDAAEAAYRSAGQLGREPQPGLALLRLAQGQAQAAASAIARVLSGTTDPLRRAQFLPSWVEIAIASGALDQARSASDELGQLATSLNSEVLLGIAAHARGLVALAGGDAQAALPSLRHALDVWQRVGAPYIAARVRVALGQACSALGDGDGAELELAAARETFERLGAAPDLVSLQREQADPAQPKPKDTRGLSTRELQVLRLVASGKTNKQIASELFLSEKTVDRHVSNIFDKLAVSTRAAATAFAYEHALL